MYYIYNIYIYIYREREIYSYVYMYICMCVYVIYMLIIRQYTDSIICLHGRQEQKVNPNPSKNFSAGKECRECRREPPCM